MKHAFIVSSVIGLCLANFNIHGQFAPPAGQAGTTAMYKDSSAFVAWATQATVVRGYQDISSPGLGYANVGDSTNACGHANSDVVSLGDRGYCTMQFSAPVINGPGFDFAVFENSFDDAFLELAFVEVSSDGGTFFRFPATSNTDTTMQTNSFGLTDATKINNLAGKYKGQYGTPFDLDDIPDNAGLNKQAITHIRIMDVVGCIQNDYCTRDVNNHKVNDPWPTAFGSGGFDLDAVGVIHQQAVSVKELEQLRVTVFPNPVTDFMNVCVATNETCSLTLSNALGENYRVAESINGVAIIQLSGLTEGVYLLTVTAGGKQKQLKIVKQ